MRATLWLTTLAILAVARGIENKTDKSKRQVDGIRSPQNLQYSLVLPHSRVSSFRALGRRAGSGPTRQPLPPYAVQMEPMVQYSQKDPLYDPTHDSFDDGALNKNELQAQSKILNIQERGELLGEGTHIETAFGPPYGSLQTAPLYGHQHQHYYEEPEPIIEIIIKESNETLPAPPTLPPSPVKKEPVQVFYVKYSKDPHSEDKVIYDKPVLAITPPSNIEEHHRESYVTVTPEPILPPAPSTTLRTIIKPDSEVYHSDSGVRVTFGTENKHHGDDYVGSERHEETAPRPAIAYPQQQALQSQSSPSVHPQQKQFNEHSLRHPQNFQPKLNTRPTQQYAQSRIQFQQPFLPQEQQLPQQSIPHQSFRNFQSHVSRQGPFGPPTAQTHPQFLNGPSSNIPRQISGPSFTGPNLSGLIGHNIQNTRPNGPPGPTSPTFGPPRIPTLHLRPNQPTNSPPRNTFPPGPPRAFHSGPQPQYFLNEPKYLQENYHTITTEQLDQQKDPQIQNRPLQNFDFVPRPTQLPQPSPTLLAQEEYNKRFYPQLNEHVGRPVNFPVTQQLPQQRPPQQFLDNTNIRPNPSSRPPNFGNPQFLNYKPDSDLNFRPNSEHNFRPNSEHNFRPDSDLNGSPFNQQQIQQHQQFNTQQQGQRNHNFNRQHPSQQHPSHQHPQQQQPLPHHEAQFPTTESTHLNARFPGPSSPPNESHPSARPPFVQDNQDQSQLHSQAFHQQNIAHVVPNGGELIASIPKYEQHITVSGSGNQPQYTLGKPTPTPSLEDQQFRQNEQQQFYDKEHEQVRLQLAQNVQKQQEEIQRLQSQLLEAQQQQQEQQKKQNAQKQYQYQQQHNQQHQQQQQQRQQQHHQNSQYQHFNFPSASTYKPELLNSQQEHSSHDHRIPQERSKNPSAAFASSTTSPYYQSTSRTVDITPTTQRYVSSTHNSINTTPEAKKAEKKKKPTIELPDEVPDDLRQQLLSSGILDNADISVLDYDKVGDTSLDQLPPDQLANFFSAGGGQQISASENLPVVVKSNGDQLSRVDDLEDDQEVSASENVATAVAAPTAEKKSDVEMKVVHFDPTTMEGQSIAQEYVKHDATKLDAVALNDKKYNRYLPLKVSGNQFPVPDILKGRKVTSVVVLAPVVTEALKSPEHSRPERATENKLKGIKFVAGDSLQQVLKKPSTENFQKWLDAEKQTAIDQQSVILLVTGDENSAGEKEIFMFDLESNGVNRLSGDLSSAFVEAAENNSLSKDIEKLAIEGDGTPESFKTPVTTSVPLNEEDSNEDDARMNDEEFDEDMMSEGSDNVPLYADFSSMKLNQDGSRVSISTGYSKTKKGRLLSHQ